MRTGTRPHSQLLYHRHLQFVRAHTSSSEMRLRMSRAIFLSRLRMSRSSVKFCLLLTAIFFLSSESSRSAVAISSPRSWSSSLISVQSLGMLKSPGARAASFFFCAADLSAATASSDALAPLRLRGGAAAPSVEFFNLDGERSGRDGGGPASTGGVDEFLRPRRGSDGSVFLDFLDNS